MKSMLWILQIALAMTSCASRPGLTDASPGEILGHEYRIEYRELGTPFLYESLKPAVVRDFGRLLSLAESEDAQSATLYFETEGHTLPQGGRISLDPPEIPVTDYRMSVILQAPDGKILWKSHTAGWAKIRVGNAPAPIALTASVRHLADELACDLGLEN